MKKIFIIMLLGSFIAFAWATGEDENSEQLTLTFYGAVQEDHVDMLGKQFEKETGIKTNFVRMSSGEILARLKAEKNNMSASVWYGGPIDTMVAAKEEGLIEPYKSPGRVNLKKEFQDEEGYWTGIYVGYLGFLGNQKILNEKGIEMPTSWADLLKPEYKGEIVVAHPGSSGTAYTMLSTLVQSMGEEEAMEYVKKLNGQIRQYTKSGSAPARMVGIGEATIGITFLHDAIKYKKNGYEDIIIAAPEEGTGYEIGGVALLKNGPDQEAGKRFIDWVLTKKTQELGKTVGSFQFLTNKDAKPPEEADPIKNTKLIDYDFNWAGKNRVRLVEKFSEVTSVSGPTE